MKINFKKRDLEYWSDLDLGLHFGKRIRFGYMGGYNFLHINLIWWTIEVLFFHKEEKGN